MPRRVYIPNKGPHDYEGAKNYGTLVFCSEGILNRYDASQMSRIMSEALAESGPEDYILITSLSSLCSIASATFAHRHGRLNLLLYNPLEGYVARHLMLS